MVKGLEGQGRGDTSLLVAVELRPLARVVTRTPIKRLQHNFDGVDYELQRGMVWLRTSRKGNALKATFAWRAPVSR